MKYKILPTLLAFALVAGSCNKNGTVSTSSPTTSGCLSLDQVSYLTGAQQECCCNGTTATNPPPSSCGGSADGFACPIGPAGTAQTAGMLNDAAQAYNAGAAAGSAAGQMLSSSAATKNSEPDAVAGMAASTGGGITSAVDPATIGSGTTGLVSSPAGSAAGSNGSTPNSANSNGSTASLSGSATSPVAAASPSIGVVVGDGAGYAQGGVGGVSGKADLFGLGTSDSNTSNGGGKADSKDLSSNRAPASDVATNSSDPADYFTRLSAADNLFKIVERKYTDKSRQWALSDAQALSQAGALPTKK